jgi:hypothetical protein
VLQGTHYTHMSVIDFIASNTYSANAAPQKRTGFSAMDRAARGPVLPMPHPARTRRGGTAIRGSVSACNRALWGVGGLGRGRLPRPGVAPDREHGRRSAANHRLEPTRWPARLSRSVIRANTFLFVIAIFSVYLALSGWRYAKYRWGRPPAFDWGSAGVMVVTSTAMVLLGVFILTTGEMIGLVLIVFGGIGAALSYSDLRTLGAGRIEAKQRIAAHLTRMLAGTIAAVTAFLVTNVSFEPVFLLWLAPTVVMTPLIVWWNRRIQAGERPCGMPEGPQ